MAHVADTADTSTLLSSRHALSTGLYKFFHVLLCLCSTRKPCGNSQPNPANDPWHGNKSKIFQFPENTHTSLPFGRLQRRQAAIRAHHYVTLGFGAEMKLFHFLLARVPLGSFKGTRTKAHESARNSCPGLRAHFREWPQRSLKNPYKTLPRPSKKAGFHRFSRPNPRISEPAKPFKRSKTSPWFCAHESARKPSQEKQLSD